jgi:hypothetical protein
VTPPTEPDSRFRVSRQHEPGAVGLILLAFIAINLLVATRTPTIYVDEVQYCDPAANLYFGNGFTSTVWGQSRDAFWTGNVPLYQGFLWACFKLAGFGLFQARAVNTLLTAAAAALLWSTLRRTGLVREPANRLLALALVLSGSVSTLTFRTIRPDATMFFVCALVFFAGSLTALGAARWWLAGAASIFLPLAGIPMLPYAAIVLALIFIFYRFAHWWLLVASGVGVIAGIGVLVWFYSHFSSVRTFADNVLPFTGLGVAGAPAMSWRERIFGDSPGSENLWTSFFGNPFEFERQKTLFDYSAALLFAATLVLALSAGRKALPEGRRFTKFIVALALVVPPFMHLAGHYQSYYRWMTYIPLALAVPRLLELHHGAGASRQPRRLVVALACLSLVLGLPLRTLATLPGWRARSPAPLDQVSTQVARPDDVAIVNYKAYFALRPRTRLIYACRLTAQGDFSRIVDLPTNQVTLLCVFQADLADVTNRIGGQWSKVQIDQLPGAAALAGTRYAMDFYRRAAQ